MAKPCENKPTATELRRLYVEEDLTQRQIGNIFGVRHITIRRWMIQYGIEARPPYSRDTLASRGITPPTRDELFNMVHFEHLSYVQIAEKYGVDYTAVPHWLTKHGIPKPTIWGTRRKGKEPKLPTPEEARAMYESGQALHVIGNQFGVSAGPIRRLVLEAGGTIRRDGWDGGKRYDCADGHLARSKYEQRVDDWLYRHGVSHELEPTYPWDRRYMADFLVGNTYIEVWGVSENESYKQRKQMKIQRCKESGLDLIQINYWQFAKGRKWWKPLLRLLDEPTQECLPLFAA